MLQEGTITAPVKIQMDTQAHKILLVDDDEDTLRIASHYLKRKGYEVVLAKNGREALELAQAETPALAIVDRMMPGIDGIEVARRLREDYPEIYLIMLTALDGQENRITGLEAGADDYITKPFSPKELMLRVESKIRRIQKQAGKSNTIGKVAFKLGDPAQAVSKEAQVQSYLEVAGQLAQAGKKDQAQEIFLQILELDPSNKKALYWLTWYSTDPHQTAQHLERLAEAYPSISSLQQVLGIARQRCQVLKQPISTSAFVDYQRNAEQIKKDHLNRANSRKPEKPVSAIGQLLQEKGYITKGQLDMAISLQGMLRRFGEQPKLGQILIECGYLTLDQLNEALAEQHEEFNS
jgi:DNA-binding response OmpR family regulator